MLKRFLKDQSGASAIEFSIIAVPLFMTIFANLELGVKSIQQNELDIKMAAAASHISLNAQPANSAQQFINDTFCKDIETFLLDCDKVEIGAREIPIGSRMSGFQNRSIIGQWNIGCAGSAVLVEMNYPVTNITHPIIIGDVIKRGALQYYRSRAVIRREPQLASNGGASC